MEAAALIPVSVLAGCEFTEILCGFRDDIVEELEDDAAEGRAVFGDVELEGTGEYNVQRSGSRARGGRKGDERGGGGEGVIGEGGRP